MDAVDAARLGLADQVRTDLVGITERYQAYMAGTSSAFGGAPGDEPYLEQSATVGTALNEALATDYDGTLRFAPAWPSDWNVSGTVYVRNGSKVDVQVQNGTLTTAALVAGRTGPMTVRNPWAGKSGHAVKVVNGSTGALVTGPTTATTFTLPVKAGASYLIEDTAAPTTGYPCARVTGTAATTAKHLGPVRIGIDPPVRAASLAASFDNVGISADDNTDAGNYDGSQASYSQTALDGAGAAPGAKVSSSGIDFTMPEEAAGSPDNTVANGQIITFSGSGSTLGFLISGDYGSATGTGTVTYTDGATQSCTLTAPDWFSTDPPAGGSVAVNSTYQNRPGNTSYQHSADIFSGPSPSTPPRRSRLSPSLPSAPSPQATRPFTSGPSPWADPHHAAVPDGNSRPVLRHPPQSRFHSRRRQWL